MDHWPYESGSEYPRGPLLYFVAVLPMLVGPFAFPAMWIGMWRNLSYRLAGCRGCGNIGSHGWLMAALPLAILIGHSLLFWLGKFSSSGSPRYLLIVAPLWGCLSARGWEWVFTRLRWPRPLSWAALAVVTAGIGELLLANSARAAIRQLEPGPAIRAVVSDQSAAGEISAHHVESSGDIFLSERQSLGPQRGGALVAGGDRSSAAGRGADLGPGIRGQQFRSELLVVPLQHVIQAGWVNDRRAEWQSGVNGPAMLLAAVITTQRCGTCFFSPAG